MRRPDSDDVVIVELDDGEHDAAPDGDAAGAGERHARRTRLLRRTGVGVIVLLVAAVALSNVMVARRAAERRAALAEVPWVLPAMAGPLTETWRVDGGWVMAETSTAILVSAVDGSGGVRAVDPASGAVLWEITSQQGYCLSPMAGQVFAAPTDASPAAGHDLVVCEETTQGDATVGWSVTSYDGRTGERLATFPTGDAVMATGTAGDDYLAMSIRDDGTVVVTAWDLLSGAERWTWRSDPGSASPEAMGTWQLAVGGDTVTVGGPDGLSLSRSTGEPVATGTPVVLGTLRLAAGGSLELVYDVAETRVLGRVVNDDGSVRFEFDGWPAVPYDTSRDGVLVVQQMAGDVPIPGAGMDFVGLDPASGAELWRHAVDPASGGSLVSVDGVALVLSMDTVVAFDVRTGTDLWSRPGGSFVSFTTPVTDGDVVVLPAVAPFTGAAGIAAVDLRTGQERWWMPAPAGLSWMSVSRGERVLLGTGTELIAFRP